MKKRMISSLLVLSTLLMPSTVFASEKENISIDTNSVVENVDIDVSSDDEFEESEPMTYDEIVEVYAEDNNVSVKEAKNQLGKEHTKVTRARDEVFRTYKKSVKVDKNYKVIIKFYCYVSEWDNYRGILEVLNASLDRNYDGKSKQFSGELYVHLEDANTIYYELNGDFYDNGKTTWTGKLGLKVDEAGSCEGSVSYAEDHYAYVCEDGRYYLN